MVASTTLVSISRSKGIGAPATWMLAILLMIPAGRTNAAPGPSPDVIPRPLQVVSRPGVFVVPAALTLIVPPSDPQARATAADLRDLLASGRPALLPLSVHDGAAQDGALLLRRVADPALGAEGYRLSVTPQRIELAADGPAGWLYGGITLWQLVHGAGPGPAVIDAQLIE